VPIDYRVDSEHGILFVADFGEVEEAELNDQAARMGRDPSIVPALNALVDLREASIRDLQAKVIRDLAVKFREMNLIGDRTKMAIAATNDVVFGMARIYGAVRSNSKLEARVFREITEARKWLETDD
jgi:hypothetical protein